MARFTLALETSGIPASIAAAVGDGAPVEERFEGERPDVARLLVSRIDGCLRRLGCEPGDLGRIVLGVGPGSYTALRIGAAAARTLAFASGAPLVAFASSLGVAQRAFERGALEKSAAPRAVTAVDSLRGDFGIAIYERGEKWPREVEPPRLRQGSELARLAGEGVCWVCDRPEALAPFLPAGIPILRAEPSAAALIELDRAGAAPLPSATPLYLRASAAEERLRAKR